MKFYDGNGGFNDGVSMAVLKNFNGGFSLVFLEDRSWLFGVLWLCFFRSVLSFLLYVVNVLYQ